MAITKGVVQFKNENPMNVFSSMETTRNYGFDPTHVSKCARGIRKMHGGFQWCYLPENQKKIIDERKKNKKWDKVTKTTIHKYGLEL